MGVTTHPYVPVSDAPYPVINAQPTFFATFRNLTLGDYFLFLSMTTLGAGYGFAAGARALLRLRTSTPGCLLHSHFFPRSSSDLFFSAFYSCAGKPLRRQSFFYIGSITAVVVATYSFRASWLRLTGQRPNPSECARAGVEFVEPKSFGY